MLLVLSLLGAVGCAVCTLSVKRLLTAAIWLAGASAFTAGALYTLGGHVVAVMELSVGAGLVTILFVFAIDLVGDAPRKSPPRVPRWLAVVLVVAIALALAGLLFPFRAAAEPATGASGTVRLWGERQLDVLLQVVWLVSGALTVSGLLVERRATHVEEARKPKPALRSGPVDAGWQGQTPAREDRGRAASAAQSAPEDVHP
jgi:NADH:ubiquinone oxidoreductase subunit 6 (subunit J)